MLDRAKIDQYLPKWRRHRAYTYSKNGVTVRSDKAMGQRVIGRIRDDDGSLKEISVPHQPYERWVDPAGRVCALVVGPNRSESPSPAYAAALKATKIANGWIPYDFPPLGSAYTPEQWEKHVDQEVADRQKAHEAHEKLYARAYQAREELLANKTGEALAEAIRSIGPAIADAVDQMDQKRIRRQKDPKVE